MGKGQVLQVFPEEKLAVPAVTWEPMLWVLTSHCCGCSKILWWHKLKHVSEEHEIPSSVCSQSWTWEVMSICLVVERLGWTIADTMIQPTSCCSESWWWCFREQSLMSMDVGWTKRRGGGLDCNSSDYCTTVHVLFLEVISNCCGAEGQILLCKISPLFRRGNCCFLLCEGV